VSAFGAARKWRKFTYAPRLERLPHIEGVFFYHRKMSGRNVKIGPQDIAPTIDFRFVPIGLRSPAAFCRWGGFERWSSMEASRRGT
jgi:hypothetical protein